MKDAETIYREMMASFTEKTGFAMEDSSDLAVRLYAAAAELESLYGYGDWVLRQSFPQSADGEYLNLHAALRGLARRGAANAAGSIRFSVPEARADDLTVPAGTVCMTAGAVRFVTDGEGTIAAGELSCTVPAHAENPGAGGNAEAGTVTHMVQAPVGVGGCTNPSAFSGGQDAESDDALRLRLLETFSSLPNGANAAFYETRARAFAGVGDVEVLPRNRGVGTVDLIVSSVSGQSDPALVQAVQDDLDSVREIAVDVLVTEPTRESVDFSVTVWPSETATGAEAVEAAEEAVRAFFHGGLLSKPVYLAEIGSRIFATGRVKNYVISAPAADVAAQSGVLPVLGTLTVTEGA